VAGRLEGGGRRHDLRPWSARLGEGLPGGEATGDGGEAGAGGRGGQAGQDVVGDVPPEAVEQEPERPGEGGREPGGDGDGGALLPEASASCPSGRVA
jgi:hypothetical protein